MASCLRLPAASLQKFRPILHIRQISTSKKKNETVTVANPSKCEVEEPVGNPKNWVTYGFDRKNAQADQSSLHLTFFGSITLGLVLAGYLLWYAPDVNLKDWAQREAFIELRRREEKGLPAIDRNLVDPSKFQLPSDDELGNTEIII